MARMGAIVPSRTLSGATSPRRQAPQRSGLCYPCYPRFAAMVSRGVVTSKDEAFERYLGDRSPAFSPKPYHSAEDVIDLVHRVGGVAVLQARIAWSAWATGAPKEGAEGVALGARRLPPACRARVGLLSSTSFLARRRHLRRQDRYQRQEHLTRLPQSEFPPFQNKGRKEIHRGGDGRLRDERGTGPHEHRVQSAERMGDE